MALHMLIGSFAQVAKYPDTSALSFVFRLGGVYATKLHQSFGKFDTFPQAEKTPDSSSLRGSSAGN